MTKKAIILLSGGLDSATTAAIALAAGYQLIALSFRYGQRHERELAAAKKIANFLNIKEHHLIEVNLSLWGGSALTDQSIAIPQEGINPNIIPITYVPGRNTVFISIALSLAEAREAEAIYLGINAVDYSGYPDCRPEFINAFQDMANLATKAGVEGHKINIHAPLIKLSKSEIIKQGLQLGVDYAQTVSCYSADQQGRACGHCDACRLRAAGFAGLGVADATLYQQ